MLHKGETKHRQTSNTAVSYVTCGGSVGARNIRIYIIIRIWPRTTATTHLNQFVLGVLEALGDSLVPTLPFLLTTSLGTFYHVIPSPLSRARNPKGTFFPVDFHSQYSDNRFGRS